MHLVIASALLLTSHPQLFCCCRSRAPVLPPPQYPNAGIQGTHSTRSGCNSCIVRKVATVCGSDASQESTQRASTACCSPPPAPPYSCPSPVGTQSLAHIVHWPTANFAGSQRYMARSSRARKRAAAHTCGARHRGAAAGARECCLGRGTSARRLRPPPSTEPAERRRRLHCRRRPPAAAAWGRLRLRGGRERRVIMRYSPCSSGGLTLPHS